MAETEAVSTGASRVSPPVFVTAISWDRVQLIVVKQIRAMRGRDDLASFRRLENGIHDDQRCGWMNSALRFLDRDERNTAVVALRELKQGHQHAKRAQCAVRHRRCMESPRMLLTLYLLLKHQRLPRPKLPIADALDAGNDSPQIVLDPFERPWRLVLQTFYYGGDVAARARQDGASIVRLQLSNLGGVDIIEPRAGERIEEGPECGRSRYGTQVQAILHDLGRCPQLSACLLQFAVLNVVIGRLKPVA